MNKPLRWCSAILFAASVHAGMVALYWVMSVEDGQVLSVTVDTPVSMSFSLKQFVEPAELEPAEIEKAPPVLEPESVPPLVEQQDVSPEPIEEVKVAELKKPKPEPPAEVKSPQSEPQPTVAEPTDAQPVEKVEPVPHFVDVPKPVPEEVTPEFQQTELRYNEEGLPFVDQPEYLFKVAPVYPKRAKQRKQEGQVIVDAVLDSNGAVKTITVHQSSGYKSLDQSAVRAVRRWRFKPLELQGREMQSVVRVPVTFKLKASSV